MWVCGGVLKALMDCCGGASPSSAVGEVGIYLPCQRVVVRIGRIQSWMWLTLRVLGEYTWILNHNHTRYDAHVFDLLQHLLNVRV